MFPFPSRLPLVTDAGTPVSRSAGRAAGLLSAPLSLDVGTFIHIYVFVISIISITGGQCSERQTADAVIDGSRSDKSLIQP